MFRLSRVQGAVRTTSRPQSYEIPPGTDLRQLTQMLAPRRPDRTAVVLVREGAGHGLRRHARTLPEGEAPAGWDRLEVDFASAETLADEVLEYGADVVVVTPDEVRAEVVARLRRVAGAVL